MNSVPAGGATPPPLESRIAAPVSALAGAGYLLRGFGMLNRPGLRRFVFVPLAINVGLFALLLWALAGQFGGLVDRLIPDLPEWLAWLSWLLWLLFGLAAAILVFFTFSIVANLIGAPFNGVLAEAVERQLTGGGPPEAGLADALKQAPAVVLDEIRKLGYFVVRAIPLLLLFLIPGVNLFAPLLWALFSAWMMAVEYADYPMGNHGLQGKEQRRRLGEKRLLALGFGGATLLATMIPLVNFLVMPAAVAGATAMWVERYRK